MDPVQEPLPDSAPETSRRKLLKAGAATVFLGIPIVGSMIPAEPAFAEPHTHCAQTYVRFLGSFCSTSCVRIYVYGLYCWGCSGQCGGLIYEIDGPC